MATDAQKPLVLIVDDDPTVRALCESTVAPHFRTVSAENGIEALRQLYAHKPDLILLDIGMPVLDGWETYRRIREIGNTPVIMLTAWEGDDHVVRGLDAGVDDYVTKPFSPTQLLARIRAALRRQGAAPADLERLSFDNGRLVVDTAKRVAIVRGQEVALSATEYKLLELLARHPGQVLTHDQILENLWGAAYAGETGYVKTYVGLLRNKIEENPRRPAYIISRRGLGYYLNRSGRQDSTAEEE